MRSLTFLKPIGSGAFGTVYLAELASGHNFRRNIAVKILIDDKQDSKHFMSRVRDEARLLGLLQDDEILQVLGLEKIKNMDAILMEYVEGADISGIIKSEHEIPLKTLATIGAITAGVLYRAHTAVDPRTQNPLNVIHRDVKPANIMITKNGGIKICDFGVARARFEGQESITLDPDVLLGTLNYMAPEYIRTGEISPAADIYGLGLSLLEIATGERFGRPHLRRKQYEQRMFELIQKLDSSHQIREIIQKMLMWDDTRRPNGLECERMLYAAADCIEGPSLRRWASEHIPLILSKRSNIPDALRLVGTKINLNDSIDTSRQKTIDKTKEIVDNSDKTIVTNVFPDTNSSYISSLPTLKYTPQQGIIFGIITGVVAYILTVGVYFI
jgi:serine/threonine protein kinase